MKNNNVYYKDNNGNDDFIRIKCQYITKYK